MDHHGNLRSGATLGVLSRVPLAKKNRNIPLPALKKQKLAAPAARVPLKELDADKNKRLLLDEKAAIAPAHTESTATAVATAAKSTRLVGDELKSWQSSWRKIMRESIVYFDTQGCESNNQTQYQEAKRAQRALKLVGCTIVPFYDRDVTIIVSRRPFSSSKVYPATDIFRDAVALKIKIWDYDKVFRFLKNLGVSDSVGQERSENLSNLLREEKVFGSTDKDPNARRDDLYYLEKNFVYVYDLSQAVRPIVVREWLTDNYPAFHLTFDGKCPFIPDNSDNLERKKLRRLQKFEATKEYRELLKKVSYVSTNNSHRLLWKSNYTANGTSTDSGSLERVSTDVDSLANDTVVENNSPGARDEEVENMCEFKPPVSLTRNSSVIQPANVTSKFYDVAASGYNGASNAMQFSMDSTLNSVALHQAQGNGLGPTVLQVPSRNINNLKRRIFMKKQFQNSEPHQKEIEMKPGYCENCRVKYDHFDDHIMSNRHRNFACNDSNFRDIDALIETLNESKCMGYVASNGDYSVAS